MKYVRREVSDFIRSSDLLLHSDSMSTPLTQMEKGLMEAYVMRLWEELKLSVDPPSIGISHSRTDVTEPSPEPSEVRLKPHEKVATAR